MLAASDILASMALVVSVLTFGITSWLNYYKSEWKKVMEEVNMSSTYHEAQEAATELYRLKKSLNARDMSRDTCKERFRRHLPDTLDYADIFFLHKRGLLREDIESPLGEDIERHCREVEAHRRKAQKAWDVIVGKYDSYQVLHQHNPVVQGLRWLVGLPNKPFLSTKWVGRGKRHVELVEPLDVANWYIVNDEDKDYCDFNEEIRPRRYVMLQQEVQQSHNRVFNDNDWVGTYKTNLRIRAERYREVVKEKLNPPPPIVPRGGQSGGAQGVGGAGGDGSTLSSTVPPRGIGTL